MNQQAKLIASDGSADYYFGYSVSIFIDYTVIGAYSDDDNGISSGSAYIFNRIGAAWYQETKLLAPDGEAYDKFGRSVSMSGNLVIIGADGNSDNGISSGSAYVFQNYVIPSVFTDFEANPLETKLIGNFPNPFNTTTTISFYLTAEDAKIAIYNIKGQKVKVLDCPDYIGNNEQAAESLSQYSVVWDGTDENNQPVSSGVYFYRLKVGNNLSGTKKMLLLK